MTLIVLQRVSSVLCQVAAFLQMMCAMESMIVEMDLMKQTVSRPQ